MCVMGTKTLLEPLTSIWKRKTPSPLISKREEGRQHVSGWPIISILGLVFHLEASEVRITFLSKKKLTLECACKDCSPINQESLSRRMQTSICIGSGLKTKLEYMQRGLTPCWRTIASIPVSPTILDIFVHSIQRIRIIKTKEPSGKIKAVSTFSGNTMLRTFALLLQYKSDS